MLTEYERAKLRIFKSEGGYPVNWYGGPREWAENWSAEQRAAGKRPTWRDFMEAARATGWPCINVPGFSGPEATPVEFLEWCPFSRGGVYVVEITGRVKIGAALNFAHRFKHLQSHSPDKLVVQAIFTPGGFGHERALHRAFAPYRLNGEWFEFAPAIRGFLTWAKLECPDRSPPCWPDIDAFEARAAEFVERFARAGSQVVHLVTKRSA